MSELEQLLGIDRSDPIQREALEQNDRDRAMFEEIKRRRLEKPGLTQEKVAEAMGVHQSTVARIESGLRDVHLSTLRSYALAVGVRIIHDVEWIPGAAPDTPSTTTFRGKTSPRRAMHPTGTRSSMQGVVWA